MRRPLKPHFKDTSTGRNLKRFWEKMLSQPKREKRRKKRKRSKSILMILYARPLRWRNKSRNFEK